MCSAAPSEFCILRWTLGQVSNAVFRCNWLYFSSNGKKQHVLAAFSQLFMILTSLQTRFPDFTVAYG